MHQKNMDTLFSIFINALSYKINMTAGHYACVDGCSKKLTVNGLLYITEIWPLHCQSADVFSHGCWYGMISYVHHSDTEMTVNVTHTTDTWLPMPHYQRHLHGMVTVGIHTLPSVYAMTFLLTTLAIK